MASNVIGKVTAIPRTDYNCGLQTCPDTRHTRRCRAGHLGQGDRHAILTQSAEHRHAQCFTGLNGHAEGFAALHFRGTNMPLQRVDQCGVSRTAAGKYRFIRLFKMLVLCNPLRHRIDCAGKDIQR